MKLLKNPNSLLAHIYFKFSNILHIGKVVKPKEKTYIFYDERVHSSKENIDTLNFQKNAHICCLRLNFSVMWISRNSSSSMDDGPLEFDL